MASLAQRTGVWANAGTQWRTGKPGLLLFLGVTKSWTRLHDWTTTIIFFLLSPCLFNFILFLNFTILYWFCQISKWICHRYTCVPYPEPSSLLRPPSPYHPSGSSQCTSPKHPVSCIEPGLATRSIYDIICISMPFSQIIPPSLSPTESKRLFYTSVSLFLSRIQGYVTIFLNSIYMH